MDSEQSRFTLEAAPDQALMKEAYRFVIFRSWRSVVYGCLAGVCLWRAGKYFYDAIYWHRLGWADALSAYLPYGIYFLLLLAAIVGFLLAMPGVYARRYMRRLEEVHGGASQFMISYRFDDDAIHSLASTGQKLETSYDKIIAVQETAHGVVLRRKAQLFEALDKSKIQGGSLEEFRAFLQQKIPEAKFRWRRDA